MLVGVRQLRMAVGDQYKYLGIICDIPQKYQTPVTTVLSKPENIPLLLTELRPDSIPHPFRRLG